MKFLQVCLLLVLSTVCRAQHVARIESRTFHHPERGILQLIRSLKSENKDFFSLEPRERDAEFDRMASVCINDPKHKEDQLCRTLDDISLALEQFARKHEIALIIDAAHGEVTTLYGHLNLADVEDITQSFVREYNRLHP